MEGGGGGGTRVGWGGVKVTPFKLIEVIEIEEFWRWATDPTDVNYFNCFGYPRQLK